MRGGLYNPRPVDDVPVNGQLTHGVTSNWAFDHAADLDAHTRDIMSVPRTGEYFCNPAAGAISYLIVANTLYGRQLVVPRDMTFDRIAVHVQTADAVNPNVRLGIYNDGVNLYPGTLVSDCGTVNVAAVGVKTIVIAQSLPKGTYWLALVGDGTPKFYCDYFTYIDTVPLGQVAGNFAQTQLVWGVAQAYGALPDPFTAAGALSFAPAVKIPLRVLTLD